VDDFLLYFASITSVLSVQQ